MTGFIERTPEGNVVFDIDGWEDLRAASVQAALRRNAAGVSQLFCRCCTDTGGLGPVLFARPTHAYLACVRQHVYLHSTGCIFHRLYGAPQAHRRTLGIFSIPKSAENRADKDPAALGTPSAEQFLTFSRFCYRALAAAATKAYLVSYATCSPGPSGESLLSALEAELQIPDFDGELTAYAAAEHSGAELHFGLIFSSPAVRSAEAFPLSVACSVGGAALRQCIFLCTREVFASALASVSDLHAAPVPPPWFFVAVIEADGEVRRLWLQPVWCDGRHLAAVDSASERTACALLRTRFGNFLKPVSRDDVAQALQGLENDDADSTAWRYRPDFVCLSGATPHHVIEWRGFRPGVIPRYDEDLAKKLSSYRSLGPNWEAQVLNAWDFPETKSSISRLDEWQGKRLPDGGISHAAARWMRERFGLHAPQASTPPSKIG